MPKFKHKLTDKQLKKLSKSNSAIHLRKDHRCHLKINFEATPINSVKFKEHIAKELDKRTLNYNLEMNDIVLRYRNVRVLQPIEANRCRQLHVTCLADIYVFKPQCGSLLSAIVNKKSDNHLGCVIYDLFNVSIIKPTDLPYIKWAGKDIEIGDEITFTVKKVDISEVIPYIIGDLVLDDEKDSVISASSCSAGVSEEQFSDLEDVMETIKDVKAKKRKLSDKIQLDVLPKKKKKT